jgi:hypothetical protein
VIQDLSKFVASAPLGAITNLTSVEILEWAMDNNIPIEFSFGLVWFMEEEHCVLYKLRFG